MGNKPSSARHGAAGHQQLSRGHTVAGSTSPDTRPQYRSDDQLYPPRPHSISDSQWQFKRRSLDLSGNPARTAVSTDPSGDDGGFISRNPDFTRPPSTRPTEPMQSGSLKGSYFRALDLLLTIRPEYQSLNDLKLDKLKPNVLQILLSAYQRLYDQHFLIIDQQKDAQQARRELQELDDERYSISQVLRARDSEIEALQYDIKRLEGDLKRKGFDPKLPDRTSRISETDDSNTAGETDDVKSSAIAERFRQKAQHGLARATPLLHAEGKRMSSVFERHASKKGGKADASSPEQSEDINEKLVILQRELERERRHSEILQQRLDKTEPMSPHAVEHRNAQTDKLSDRYVKLRQYAITKILSVLDASIGHVDQSRRHQFLVGSMEKACVVCEKTVNQFHNRMKALLLNPARGSVDTNDKDSQLPARSASFMKNVKLFDYQPEAMHSKLALRTMSAGQVPQALLSEISQFLEHMSPMTNISTLIEDIVDLLSRDFPDCTTPALLNQSTFNNYLHDVARLAWQMSVLTPPMHVETSKHSGRFDEQYHDAYLSQNITNAAIDYYLWPILFDKQHGEVLVKALVYLK